MPRNYNSASLSEMQEAAPKPTGVGAWAEKLRQAAFDAVKESDMTEIMASMVERAKGGDLAAAKLVLTYLTGGGAPPPKPQVVVVQQNIDSLAGKVLQRVQDEFSEIPLLSRNGHSNGHALPAAEKVLPKPPENEVEFVANYILHNGPTTAYILSLQVDGDISKILKHEWFEREAGEKWNITNAARQRFKN